MATSIQQNTPRDVLAWGILEEYLEEIGAIYSMRNAIFKDKELSWFDAEEFEERMEAHLDGLHLGGALALECSKQFLESNDPVEMFAAVLFLCSKDSDAEEHLQNLLLPVWQEVEEEGLQAFVNSLKLASHTKISTSIVQLLAEEKPEIKVAAIEILGYRREGQIGQLLPMLFDLSSQVLSAAARALGQLQAKEAIKSLESLMIHEDCVVQQQAILALLRIGHPIAVDHLLTLGSSSTRLPSWAAMYLGMTGKASNLSFLLSNFENSPASNGQLRAIGILGNAESIPIIIEFLKHEEDELRVEAAEALAYLTAAGLKEEVTIVEKPDPDELLEDEEPPEPKSQKVERVCTSYEEWANWWKRNRSVFRPEIRWRKGKPFDFGHCIDDLFAENTKLLVREMAYLELVIRSGHDIPFEPDWFIHKQQLALNQWKSWWHKNKERFSPGKWYFAGQEI